MARPNRTVKYQIVLTPREKAMAEKLAEATGWNQSHIWRTALASYYEMLIGGIPTCANGHTCMCPQFHPPRSDRDQLQPKSTAHTNQPGDVSNEPI